MNTFNDTENFIWSVADLIRDAFKRSKYQDVILPFTVLRRIDCVLAHAKKDVLDTYNSIPDSLKNPAPMLAHPPYGKEWKLEQKAKEAENDLRDYEYVPLEYKYPFDPLARERVPLKQNIYA